MAENTTARDEQRTRAFNPNEHVMQLKSSQGPKDYLPVQWRLVWFRDLCPQGTIETEMLHLDLERETEEEAMQWNNEKRRSEKIVKKANGIAIFRAVVKDGKGGVATGTKSEKAASFPDFIEKAETGAIGRALAALGYGTQFAPELNEEHRIVDAPVERSQPSVQTQAQPVGQAQPQRRQGIQSVQSETPAQAELGSTITEQQKSSIGKLCGHLSREVPAHLEQMSYDQAKDLIAQLSAAYREARKTA